MPLYEYHCNGCGNEFELLQKIDTPKWCTCPNCLFEARRIDCPGGSFRIEGIGIADPKSIRT